MAEILLVFLQLGLLLAVYRRYSSEVHYTYSLLSYLTQFINLNLVFVPTCNDDLAYHATAQGGRLNLNYGS